MRVQTKGRIKILPDYRRPDQDAVTHAAVSRGFPQGEADLTHWSQLPLSKTGSPAVLCPQSSAQTFLECPLSWRCGFESSPSTACREIVPDADPRTKYAATDGCKGKEDAKCSLLMTLTLTIRFYATQCTDELPLAIWYAPLCFPSIVFGALFPYNGGSVSRSRQELVVGLHVKGSHLKRKSMKRQGQRLESRAKQSELWPTSAVCPCRAAESWYEFCIFGVCVTI